MDIKYRVYAENHSVYVDFEDQQEAEKFRAEEYFGPIEVIEDGEEVGHY